VEEEEVEEEEVEEEEEEMRNIKPMSGESPVYLLLH